MSNFHSSEGRFLLKVFVVDDNRDAADSLARLLQTWGYECKVAYSAGIAFGQILAELPAVVISEIGISDMNASDFARSIRQQPALQKTILVAISSHASKQARELALSAGFDFYDTKPIDLDLLQAFLKSLASQRSSLVGSNTALAPPILKAARDEAG